MITRDKFLARCIIVFLIILFFSPLLWVGQRYLRQQQESKVSRHLKSTFPKSFPTTSSECPGDFANGWKREGDICLWIEQRLGVNASSFIFETVHGFVFVENDIGEGQLDSLVEFQKLEHLSFDRCQISVKYIDELLYSLTLVTEVKFIESTISKKEATLLRARHPDIHFFIR